MGEGPYVVDVTSGSSFLKLWDSGLVTSCSESQFPHLQSGHNTADLIGCNEEYMR